MLAHRISRSHAIRECRAVPVVAGLVILSAALAGCGGGEPVTGYAPESERAKAALDAALSAWKNGQQPSQVEFDSLLLHVEDSDWKEGKKLTGYTIVSDSAPSDTEHQARAFTVKITLDDAPAPVEVKYFVVGKQLLVARDIDFAKLSGG